MQQEGVPGKCRKVAEIVASHNDTAGLGITDDPYLTSAQRRHRDRA
jgi:hypothetical protein